MREHHKRHHHRRPRHERGGGWHHGHGREQWAAGPSFRRRFATREERIARLTDYLQHLRAEAQAVEEKIARLQSTS